MLVQLFCDYCKYLLFGFIKTASDQLRQVRIIDSLKFSTVQTYFCQLQVLFLFRDIFDSRNILISQNDFIDQELNLLAENVTPILYVIQEMDTMYFIDDVESLQISDFKREKIFKIEKKDILKWILLQNHQKLITKKKRKFKKNNQKVWIHCGELTKQKF